MSALEYDDIDEFEVELMLIEAEQRERQSAFLVCREIAVGRGTDPILVDLAGQVVALHELNRRLRSALESMRG